MRGIVLFFCVALLMAFAFWFKTTMESILETKGWLAFFGFVGIVFAITVPIGLAAERYNLRARR